MKIDETIISLEIGNTVGIKTCPIEAEEIIIGTIDQIIEVEHEITIDMMIGEITTDKMIDITIIDKIIEKIITEPNNYGKDNNMEQRYRTRSKSRDNPRNCYRDNSRERFEQGRDISRDRIRERQLQPRSRTVSEDASDRSRSKSRSRSSSRVNTNRDRIRCYRCGKNDNFARESPNAMTDVESDHSDLEQAALQILTQDNLTSPGKQAQIKCLNIYKARMAPPHLCHLCDDLIS